MREALASALESRGALEGARVLDLFAGSGAFSFETLSRGGSHAVVADRDPRAIQQIVQNANELGLRAKVRSARVDLLGDPASAVRKLPEAEGGFNLVFVDAPYAEIDSVPPLLAALVNFSLLAPCAWVVVEHPATHGWSWPDGFISNADYRYGQTGVSLGAYAPEKGRQ